MLWAEIGDDAAADDDDSDDHGGDGGVDDDDDDDDDAHSDDNIDDGAGDDDSQDIGEGANQWCRQYIEVVIYNIPDIHISADMSWYKHFYITPMWDLLHI